MPSIMDGNVSLEINALEFSSADDIMAIQTFIFITFGITLSIIVCIGVPGNCFAMVILMHRSLQSAPVCIVKVLTIHGIVNMCYSIHLDIIPAIQAYIEAKELNDILSSMNMENILNTNYSGARYCHPHIDTFVNTTNSLIAQILPSYYQIGNRTCVMNACNRQKCTFERPSDIRIDLENKSFPMYSPYQEFTSDLPVNDESMSDTDMDSIIEKAVERFIGYNIVYLGLLITFCLAIERYVAIYFPFKAVRWLTLRKTRILLIVTFLVSIATHLPQLLKEISLAKSKPRDEFLSEASADSFLRPVRKEYEQFYAIMSLLICLAIFVLNILVLVKLIFLHRKLKSCKHILHAERTEINITVAIVVLVFFQLPFHIMAATVAFIQTEIVSSSYDSFFKASAIIRFLFTAQSALNFIIYCVLARNCRKICSVLLRKVSSGLSRKLESHNSRPDERGHARGQRASSNSLTVFREKGRECGGLNMVETQIVLTTIERTQKLDSV